jgi:hypothetical protein
MTDPRVLVIILASFRRLGWLSMLALPFVLAACGGTSGGTSGY